MTRAGGVAAAQAAFQQPGGGATPTPALHDLHVSVIPINLARSLMEVHHYLHSLPGGTSLAFGIFVRARLVGALTLGAGSYNAPALVEDATGDDCLTLTRLWLSDELPKNSESRVIAVVLRSLKKHTSLKFIVSYADPAAGHIGTIYQATNWLYTGRSTPTAYYDLGDGSLVHCRSVSASLGSRSMRYLRDQRIHPNVTFQPPKHRYIYLLDPTWRTHLKVPVLPYPKKEDLLCR